MNAVRARKYLCVPEHISNTIFLWQYTACVAARASQSVSLALSYVLAHYEFIFSRS